jgi:predicted DNA-binding transcriptional regulator YafY
VIGYCCLRQDYRSFRLDRVRNAQLLSDTFTRDETFDYRAYVLKHLTYVPPRWSIEVEFQAELHLVQHKIPSSYGSLTSTPTGILFQTHHVHLPTMARYLVGLDLPFVVHQPPELRTALQHLAEQIMQIATASQPTQYQGKEIQYEHNQSPVMES